MVKFDINVSWCNYVESVQSRDAMEWRNQVIHELDPWFKELTDETEDQKLLADMAGAWANAKYKAKKGEKESIRAAESGQMFLFDESLTFYEKDHAGQKQPRQIKSTMAKVWHLMQDIAICQQNVDKAASALQMKRTLFDLALEMGDGDYDFPMLPVLKEAARRGILKEVKTGEDAA